MGSRRKGRFHRFGRRSSNLEKTRTSPGVAKEGAGKRSALLPAFGAAAIFLLCLGAFFVFRHHEPDPPLQAAPVSPPLVGGHFALRIESIPAGADVREGDRVLGTTPLELSVDDDAVRRAPRSFTLAKDGFASYAITQGPSDDSVRIVAPLVAIAPPAPTVTPPAPSSVAAAVARPTYTPPARRQGGTRSTAAPSSDGTAAGSAPPPSRPDLDIRMNR